MRMRVSDVIQYQPITTEAVGPRDPQFSARSEQSASVRMKDQLYLSSPYHT